LKRHIVTTEDGSNSVFDESLNEHFHSVHGALQESNHIFVGTGLSAAAQLFDKLNILEVGFGTGLNALLTLAAPIITNRIVNYTAIEPFPLPEEIVLELNYTINPAYNPYRDLFLKMHKQPPGIPVHLTPLFKFNRLKKKVEELQFEGPEFNLVYFDAFSPQVQPELWTTEIFASIYNCIQTGGLLVTYSCKGSVKRSLKEAGFKVEQLPGPPGKREITRAGKGEK
jgi:tRNA U34 5-methylaminomethyl-2-thiouridine-forming methyltransferase MnmC